MSLKRGQVYLDVRDKGWAAWYITRLLVKSTPKNVVFSFLFFLRDTGQGCDHIALSQTRVILGLLRVCPLQCG